MAGRRVGGKRTVISRVIAPPDMTGTRERRHQLWLRRDGNLSGRKGDITKQQRDREAGQLELCRQMETERLAETLRNFYCLPPKYTSVYSLS